MRSRLRERRVDGDRAELEALAHPPRRLGRVDVLAGDDVARVAELL